MKNFIKCMGVLCLLSASSMAKVDKGISILWVLDNSGSMVDRRNLLVKHVENFMQRLEAGHITEFQMAFTSTDFMSQGGKLLTNANGVSVITNHTPSAVQEMIQTVQELTDTSSSFWEQGLESAYQAIDKDGKNFLKSDQPLAIIYMSDEDDFSCEKDCFGVEPEHNTSWKAFPLDRYKDQLTELKADRNIETHIYPIVGTLEGTCTVASYGVRYLRLRSALQGVSGSICKSEFRTSLMNVADDMVKTLAIPTTPVVLREPVLLKKANANELYSQSLVPFVFGTGELVFSLEQGPAWMQVSREGMVTGSPRNSDMGSNSAIVAVCFKDTTSCSAMDVRVEVVTPSHPPVWKSDRMDLGTCKVGTPCTWNIRNFVTDPDGDPIKLAALILPAWLQFNSQTGALMGTPQKADVGDFNLLISAIDSTGERGETGLFAGIVTQ